MEAVQLLLVDLAQCRAATEVDWDFWKEAGKEESQLVQADVERFLGQLATERSVSASTQNQALNALVFPFPVPFPVK